jgi:hypothetical protein
MQHVTCIHVFSNHVGFSMSWHSIHAFVEILCTKRVLNIEYSPSFTPSHTSGSKWHWRNVYSTGSFEHRSSTHSWFESGRCCNSGQTVIRQSRTFILFGHWTDHKRLQPFSSTACADPAPPPSANNSHESINIVLSTVEYIALLLFGQKFTEMDHTSYMLLCKMFLDTTALPWHQGMELRRCFRF